MPKIDIEIQAFNEGSHFSQEEWWILSLNSAMLLSFFVYLGRSAYKFWKQTRDDSFEQPLAFLIVGIVIECVQLLCEFTHNVVYYFDGEGVWVFRFFASLHQAASQIVIILLIVLVASGWTITYQSILDRDHYLPLGGFIIIANGMISFLNYLDLGEYHKFHDFSGWPGFLLVVIRVGVFFVFHVCTTQTERELPNNKKKGGNVIRQLRVAGSMYILAFPLLYFLCWMFPPYMRRRVIVFGHYLVQTVAILILMNQFTSRKSKYAKAAGKDGGILPIDPKFS